MEHPRRAEGEQYLLEGKAIRWVATTVGSAPATVKRWRDKLVEDGRMTLEQAEVTMRSSTWGKEKRKEQLLAKVERIDQRIELSDVGGPAWRQKRMAATLEETFHDVLGAFQAEARRIRDPKCRMKARDKAMLIEVLGTQTRKMMALAAGMTSEEADDPNE